MEEKKQAKISRHDVLHIARLARIELAPEEVEKFTSQFGDILAFVSELDEVDTKGVEKIFQISGLYNVWRADGVGKSLSNTEVLANAPDREGGYFRVKGVLSPDKQESWGNFQNLGEKIS